MARPQSPWAASGPGRATGGRPTLQTSSNRSSLNPLASAHVTNVVNLPPKTLNFSEKALGLTTFVTTRKRSARNHSAQGPTGVEAAGGSGARGLRCPWAVAGPGRASRRRAEPKARSADGSRAGRRPRAHKAARPSGRADHAAAGNQAAARHDGARNTSSTTLWRWGESNPRRTEQQKGPASADPLRECPHSSMRDTLTPPTSEATTL